MEFPLAQVYVPNAPVLDQLALAIREGESIVELSGVHGSGKTTLLQALKYEPPSLIDGAVEYFLGSPSSPLVDALDILAERFEASRGRNLLIIDDAGRMDRGDILEGINRLGTGPWRFSTILATTTPLNIGVPVHMTPLNLAEVSRLFEAQLGQALPSEALQKLWAASQGSPLLANMLVDQWRSGRVRHVDALADLLNPLAAPGLVDSHGRPLSRDSQEEKAIISDVRFVNDALLKAVGQDPNLVHALTPREFEELCAELFQRQGYDVTITPKTRDGGKDLYLAKADGFGSFLYIVECKRFAPDRPVDVGIIRSLYGVAQHERVTAAMTLTTSYFSKDARDFADDLRYQLTLKDFIDLKLLLSPYRGA
ncbi:hypothetical protein E2553_19355 [Paraburkholderia dipogonis]|uniref:Restriction endonuclease type IV Mrr domain-containing protein n=1 Tax=Paraburkholderia dipogonis TaxID=1211383 RepID=A0A4Y8NCD8_9BURK|nr:restriction endonuclease [Paraburkholderia dipogonis]TFE46998.1 hypothetical protein E2553_19355 [Paraburkholderia dipogonis]